MRIVCYRWISGGLWRVFEFEDVFAMMCISCCLGSGYRNICFVDYTFSVWAETWCFCRPRWRPVLGQDGRRRDVPQPEGTSPPKDCGGRRLREVWASENSCLCVWAWRVSDRKRFCRRMPVALVCFSFPFALGSGPNSTVLFAAKLCNTSSQNMRVEFVVGRITQGGHTAFMYCDLQIMCHNRPLIIISCLYSYLVTHLCGLRLIIRILESNII